jgi:CheY-like chemotaxis protein
MTNPSLRVLHVEDDFADAMLVQHALCEAGDFDIDIEVACTLKEARRKLTNKEFDLVLLDLRLPDSLDPGDTLESTCSCCGDTPVLVLSGSIQVDGDCVPSNVTQIDKNKSFRGLRGNGRNQLAETIRLKATATDSGSGEVFEL